jgi:hypothetical protein
MTSDFAFQLLPLLTISEVSSELILPDPLHVAFNTYQVMKHSVSPVLLLPMKRLP